MTAAVFFVMAVSFFVGDEIGYRLFRAVRRWIRRRAS